MSEAAQSAEADASAAYLPPPEPADNPPQAQKSSSKRTLLLWIVLIVAFIAIYQLLLTPPGPRHGRRHQEPPAESGWTLPGGLLAFGWPLLVIGGFVMLVRRQIRGGNKFNLAQEPALVALAAGDTAAAERGFAEVAERYRGQIGYESMAKLNQATAVLRRGDLGRAAELLVSIERGPGLLYAAEVRLLAAISLIEVHALRGDLEAASRWLTEARRRLRRATHRTYAAAMLSRGEAILLCRQERYEEARALLTRDWRQLEGSLNVQTVRLLWLLQSFLATQLGGAREQGEASRWLDYLRPPRTGEFAELSTWPAMQLYLSTSSLTSPSPT